MVQGKTALISIYYIHTIFWQRGQEFCRCNHWRMQPAWKLCFWSQGNEINSSPTENFVKQMEQSQFFTSLAEVNTQVGSSSKSNFERPLRLASRKTCELLMEMLKITATKAFTQNESISVAARETTRSRIGSPSLLILLQRYNSDRTRLNTAMEYIA